MNYRVLLFTLFCFSYYLPILAQYKTTPEQVARLCLEKTGGLDVWNNLENLKLNSAVTTIINGVTEQSTLKSVYSVEPQFLYSLKNGDEFFSTPKKYFIKKNDYSEWKDLTEMMIQDHFSPPSIISYELMLSTILKGGKNELTLSDIDDKDFYHLNYVDNQMNIETLVTIYISRKSHLIAQVIRSSKNYSSSNPTKILFRNYKKQGNLLSSTEVQIDLPNGDKSIYRERLVVPNVEITEDIINLLNYNILRF
ncbi:MAG: hypothetical protein ACJAWV_003244 [Flammeovirgaceae bacterium]|jgi:hypothetical protein